MPGCGQAGGAVPGLGGEQTITTKVYSERRKIAEAVGSYVADLKARR